MLYNDILWSFMSRKMIFYESIILEKTTDFPETLIVQIVRYLIISKYIIINIKYIFVFNTYISYIVINEK